MNADERKVSSPVPAEGTESGHSAEAGNGNAAAEPTRLYSGIQPTGDIHIGNYLGAVANWAKLIPRYDCIYCVVDYHAITIEYDPDTMREAVLDTATMGMACGLDPDRCTLFVQSHVSETMELAWIFSTCTAIGALERMTQFKDKAAQHKQNINAGLFTYPVLQAADILGVKADGVPVGDDQSQHLELTREIARRFNHLYGPVFPDAKTLYSPAPRIMGLDGQGKMSKSQGNYIAMKDGSDTVRKKLSTAYTDPNRLRRSDPGNPDICNIFTLHKSFSGPDEVATIDAECRSAGIGCVDCKKKLGANMETAMSPIQDKYEDLTRRPDDVRDALAAGADRVRTLTAETMTEVRQSLGLR